MLKEKEPSNKIIDSKNCLTLIAPAINVIPTSHSIELLDSMPVQPKIYTQKQQFRQGRSLKILNAKMPHELIDQNTSHQTELGRFYTAENRIFVKLDEKSMRLTNFDLRPVEKVLTYALKKEPVLQYVFEVFVSRKVHYFTINGDKLASFFKELKKKIPLVVLYCDTNKSESLFTEYLTELLSDYDDGIPLTHKVAFSGWHKMSNKMHYYSNLDKNCECNRKLADISNDNYVDLYNNGLSFLRISTENISLPIFLMAHAGYFYKVFLDAGIPLQFIFDIIGPSGSRKSSVAKLIYTLFQKTSIPDNIVNFTATARSMELIAENNHDGIVVLDDLSNSTNKDNLKKFELFLRQVCDQTGRKRTVDGGRELDSVDVQFATVLTAESYFDNLDVSSKLRNIAIFINKNSINNDILYEFQEDRRRSYQSECSSILEKYMTLIIRQIEENYAMYTNMLAGYRPKNEGVKITQPRLNESRRVFHCLALLILQIGCKIMALSEVEAKQKFYEWTSIIDEMITVNQELCDATEPYMLYIKALYHLMSTNQINIAPNKKEYALNPPFYIGFWDTPNILKLLPNEMYSLISRYYSNIGRAFNRSQNEIEERLLIEGICDGYTDKGRKKPRLYKSVKINGSSISVLCFNMLCIQNAITEGENNE